MWVETRELNAFEVPDATPCYCGHDALTNRQISQFSVKHFDIHSQSRAVNVMLVVELLLKYPFLLYRAARPTVITEESLGPASLAAVANSRSDFSIDLMLDIKFLVLSDS